MLKAHERFDRSEKTLDLAIEMSVNHPEDDAMYHLIRSYFFPKEYQTKLFSKNFKLDEFGVPVPKEKHRKEREAFKEALRELRSKLQLED